MEVIIGQHLKKGCTRESENTTGIGKVEPFINGYTNFMAAVTTVIFSSVAQLCPTLCDPMGCSTPGFPVHQLWSLLKLRSIRSEMPSNHLILCCHLLLLSIFPRIRVFSSESVLRIRWPKY